MCGTFCRTKVVQMEKDMPNTKATQRVIARLQREIKILEKLQRLGGATLVVDPVKKSKITVFYNRKKIHL